MPTGIMSAGGRVFPAGAAIIVLDARMEEEDVVDDRETAEEEFVGEVDGVFDVGKGTDEAGMEREMLG